MDYYELLLLTHVHAVCMSVWWRVFTTTLITHSYSDRVNCLCSLTIWSQEAGRWSVDSLESSPGPICSLIQYEVWSENLWVQTQWGDSWCPTRKPKEEIDAGIILMLSGATLTRHVRLSPTCACTVHIILLTYSCMSTGQSYCWCVWNITIMLLKRALCFL